MAASKSHDIRQWARSTGREVGDRGRIPDDIRADYDAEHAPEDLDDPVDDAEVVEQAAPVEETPPKMPTTAERFRHSFDTAKAKRQNTRTKAKRPAVKHQRASIEEIMTGGWGLLSGLVLKAGLPPAAFIMSKQAPVAGMLLDDALKGSAIDRLAQPFARQSDRARLFKALFLPPVAAAVIQARPDQYERIKPSLERAIADWLDVAGPKVEEIMRREAVFREKYGEEVGSILKDFENVMGLTLAAKQAAADQAAGKAPGAHGAA